MKKLNPYEPEFSKLNARIDALEARKRDLEASARNLEAKAGWLEECVNILYKILNEHTHNVGWPQAMTIVLGPRISPITPPAKTPAKTP